MIILHLTCPVWGESIGQQWIPLTKTSDEELWCFRWSTPDQTVKQTIEIPVIWNANALIMTSLYTKQPQFDKQLNGCCKAMQAMWLRHLLTHCPYDFGSTWWRHQMETFSALLAICAGNSPVPGEFTAQRPVTRSFDVFFDLRLNNRLSKQSWGWWFETLPCPIWRHSNEF